MALQTATLGWARPALRHLPARHAYRAACLLVPAGPARRRCIRTRCSAAAISAGPGQQVHAKEAISPFKRLLSWFDVGVAEVDKQRQPAPSLERTMALVAQLVSKETKLLGVAAVFMVRILVEVIQITNSQEFDRRFRQPWQRMQHITAISISCQPDRPVGESFIILVCIIQHAVSKSTSLSRCRLPPLSLPSPTSPAKPSMLLPVGQVSSSSSTMLLCWEPLPWGMPPVQL